MPSNLMNTLPVGAAFALSLASMQRVELLKFGVAVANKGTAREGRLLCDAYPMIFSYACAAIAVLEVTLKDKAPEFSSCTVKGE